MIKEMILFDNDCICMVWGRDGDEMVGSGKQLTKITVRSILGSRVDSVLCQVLVICTAMNTKCLMSGQMDSTDHCVYANFQG